MLREALESTVFLGSNIRSDPMGVATGLAAGVGTGMLLKNDVTASSILPADGLVDVKRLSVDIKNIVESPNKNERKYNKIEFFLFLFMIKNNE